MNGYRPNEWLEPGLFPPPMGYLPIVPNVSPNFYGTNHPPYFSHSTMDVKSMLENPLHPIYTNSPHVYPNPPQVPPAGNAFGENPIVQAFKTENGSFDFQKIINTANQLLGTLQQTSSLLKGIGQFFKG